jgi:hypothetical protein
MDRSELRRKALRAFVMQQGGYAAVVKKFKLTASQSSYLSQLTTEDSSASFGERSAKNWELRLRLQPGSLTGQDRSDGVVEPKDVIVRKPSLRDALDVVGLAIDACEKSSVDMLAGTFSAFAKDPNNEMVKQFLEQMLTTKHQHAHSNQTRKAA